VFGGTGMGGCGGGGEIRGKRGLIFVEQFQRGVVTTGSPEKNSIRDGETTQIACIP